MKELFHNISELTVLEFLLIGILLFAVLRFAQKALNAYIRKKQASPILNRFFPIIEFSIWLLFLTWGAKQIFQTGIAGSILLLLIMVGILMWAGSFVTRDWIAGIVFKAEDRYKVNDIICFQNTRGRLMNLGYRSLTIETAENSTVEIPYSILVRERAIERIPRESACSKFKISVPMQIPFPEIQQTLQTIALCAPWSSITRMPHIQIRENRDNQYTVEVTTYMVDQMYSPEVEAYINEHITF